MSDEVTAALVGQDVRAQFGDRVADYVERSVRVHMAARRTTHPANCPRCAANTRATGHTGATPDVPSDQAHTSGGQHGEPQE